MSNLYLPKGLPLLSDHALRSAVATYREAVSILVDGFPLAYTEAESEVEEALREMEEALSLMEHELEVRGIKPDRTYVAGSGHRPPRRIELSTGPAPRPQPRRSYR